MQFLFNIQLFAHKKGQGSVKNILELKNMMEKL